MNKARIQIAKPDIVKFFEAYPTRVFKLSDLASILSQQREFWRLALRTTVHDFTRFLMESSNLRLIDLPFPYRGEKRYSWGYVPLLDVLMTVKNSPYFTHYTALRIHGLTEQVPKTIYLNHEQRQHVQNRALEQSRIDLAFSHSQRESNNVIELKDYRVCLINGMNTNQLGVINSSVDYDGQGVSEVRVTDIERTLIDVTVRPNYAGGPGEVLKAFANARGKMSVNRLAATLLKLGYVYPYHQSIGFYLERAGYESEMTSLMRQFPIEFDFYLAHKMGRTDYVKDWRLNIPAGF